jgi:hypothetical protein
MFGDQALPDSMRGLALLTRSVPVGFQNRVDDGFQRSEFGPKKASAPRGIDTTAAKWGPKQSIYAKLRWHFRTETASDRWQRHIPWQRLRDPLHRVGRALHNHAASGQPRDATRRRWKMGPLQLIQLSPSNALHHDGCFL